MSEPSEYELDMPFVTVASKGGPYDDESYTAGWEAASMFVELGNIRRMVGDVTYLIAVRTANLPQIDLIVMQFGWTMTPTDMGDGWSQVAFTRKPGP